MTPLVPVSKACSTSSVTTSLPACQRASDGRISQHVHLSYQAVEVDHTHSFLAMANLDNPRAWRRRVVVVVDTADERDRSMMELSMTGQSSLSLFVKRRAST